MGTNQFEVPSKYLIISWICWFYQVRNVWEFLATSHAPTTDNDNLSNKPHFCLGLLDNLEDLLRAAYSISNILDFFITFLPHNTASHWAHWIVVQQKHFIKI